MVIVESSRVGFQHYSLYDRRTIFGREQSIKNVPLSAEEVLAAGHAHAATTMPWPLLSANWGRNAPYSLVGSVVHESGPSLGPTLRHASSHPLVKR